jgi:hypothetical protein
MKDYIFIIIIALFLDIILCFSFQNFPIIINPYHLSSLIQHSNQILNNNNNRNTYQNQNHHYKKYNKINIFALKSTSTSTESFPSPIDNATPTTTTASSTTTTSGIKILSNNIEGAKNVVFIQDEISKIKRYIPKQW